MHQRDVPTVAFRSLLLLLTHQLRVLNSEAAVILPVRLWRFPNTTIRGAVERGSRRHRPTVIFGIFMLADATDKG